jgi:hypothetical protein
VILPLLPHALDLLAGRTTHPGKTAKDTASKDRQSTSTGKAQGQVK